MRTASLDILDDLLRPVTKRTTTDVWSRSTHLPEPFSGKRCPPPAPDQDRINREVIAEMVADWNEESTIVGEVRDLASGDIYTDCYINTETGEWFQPGTMLSGYDHSLVRAS